MLSMVTPFYISEISPPEVRGIFLVLEEFAIVSDIVVAFWITYGTRYMSGNILGQIDSVVKDSTSEQGRGQTKGNT